MAFEARRSGALVLSLIVGLALLGGTRMGWAAGTWSVISLPQSPGEVIFPRGIAVDPAGNLYVSDEGVWNRGRIEKRDAQGNWSILATGTIGDAPPGQVSHPTALAADTAGNLYVAEWTNGGRIQKRDAQGNWSVLADRAGDDPVYDQVYDPTGLAVDTAGNLYVGEDFGVPCVGHGGRIEKRDAQGNWSVIATEDQTLTQRLKPYVLAVDRVGNLYVGGENGIQKRDARGNWSVAAADVFASALAVDAAGSLYVAESDYGRVRKRDAQGNWSILATQGSASGQVSPGPGCVLEASDYLALAVDAVGSLYIVDLPGPDNSWRIQQRDAQGRWSTVNTVLSPGEVYFPSALAVDTGGNLYVADQGSYDGRIQQRDAQGRWSVIATHGADALAVDAAGDLYAAGSQLPAGRIQQRDAQGNWSVIGTFGTAPGQFDAPEALAADTVGNLYVADEANGYGRVQQRDAQGHWSVIATAGSALGQVSPPTALAVDMAGNLYVADVAHSPSGYSDRIQKRDAQGNWSVIATGGLALGEVNGAPVGLAVDATGNLYVTDNGSTEGRIQKRDTLGGWSLIATSGADLGQVSFPSGLAVIGAGNLYVADTGNNRVQVYTPGP